MSKLPPGVLKSFLEKKAGKKPAKKGMPGSKVAKMMKGSKMDAETKKEKESKKAEGMGY